MSEMREEGTDFSSRWLELIASERSLFYVVLKTVSVDGWWRCCCCFCPASHLTTILQGTGTQLSRSVSSAGEHVSMSYVNLLMPKRAETFAGFDTSFEVPKREFGAPNALIPCPMKVCLSLKFFIIELFMVLVTECCLNRWKVSGFGRCLTDSGFGRHLTDSEFGRCLNGYYGFGSWGSNRLWL